MNHNFLNLFLEIHHSGIYEVMSVMWLGGSDSRDFCPVTHFCPQPHTKQTVMQQTSFHTADGSCLELMETEAVMDLYELSVCLYIKTVFRHKNE